jgi:hypothetical protein
VLCYNTREELAALTREEQPARSWQVTSARQSECLCAFSPLDSIDIGAFRVLVANARGYVARKPNVDAEIVGLVLARLQDDDQRSIIACPPQPCNSRTLGSCSPQ